MEYANFTQLGRTKYQLHAAEVAKIFEQNDGVEQAVCERALEIFTRTSLISLLNATLYV